MKHRQSGFLVNRPATGEFVEIQGRSVPFRVPYGYVSNSSLSSTATFDNTTISDMGLTPGSYTDVEYR